MAMRQRYRLFYKFKEAIHETAIPERWGIDSVKNGFWVTREMQLGEVSAKSVYWIPPHKVEHIERIHEEESHNG